MSVTEFVSRYAVAVTPEQMRACLYLERRGKRFCIDFGYENAVSLARADWRARRRKKASR